MWPDLIAKAKKGGVNVIQSYVFWSGHEPRKGEYNFRGRYNLPRFVQLVGEAGLYFNLRIGPYICAEWNFGGFPVWLRDVPGIVFRTDNEPFKEEMERFTKKVVDLMKGSNLFAWQGGPIVMAQIENEYGHVEKAYGAAGQDYVQWIGEMVASLGADIPWIMCQQFDAPPNVINTCNGYYCDGFKPSRGGRPALWTEDWNGWFQGWGGRIPHRPVEDNAFAVARFFARGGSFNNYYMYFGGTNFERTAGGPFITTSYDYDAPLDEYGLVREPKWGHLKELHAALMLCETALLFVDDEPEYIALGPKQEAHVYTTISHPEKCAAFLSNLDARSSAVVEFRGMNYELPAWSVSILADCKTVVYNSAKIGTQTTVMAFKRNTAVSFNNKDSEVSNLEWELQKEPVGARAEGSSKQYGLKEQVEITKDSTDYLWYTTRFQISREDAEALKSGSGDATLFLEAARDVLHIYVNGNFVSSAFGWWFSVKESITLREGSNDLALLCMTVGMKNGGPFFEKDGAGIKGKVQVQGLASGDLDLTSFQWVYQVGLRGEELKYYSDSSVASGGWVPASVLPLDRHLMWYRSTFPSPGSQDPVALDMGSMGKGQVWVNGHHLGRYWTLSATDEGCGDCDYRGTYHPKKCATGCGEITQRWYHVPRGWLRNDSNTLVLFEELGGNPVLISVATRSPDTICALVSDTQPPAVHLWRTWKNSQDGVSQEALKPTMRLTCYHGQIISDILFASYGNPFGACGNYSVSFCHATNSRDLLEKECLGRTACVVTVSPSQFGGDPCPGESKALAVQALCKRANETVFKSHNISTASFSSKWQRFELNGERSHQPLAD